MSVKKGYKQSPEHKAAIAASMKDTAIKVTGEMNKASDKLSQAIDRLIEVIDQFNDHVNKTKGE